MVGAVVGPALQTANSSSHLPWILPGILPGMFAAHRVALCLGSSLPRVSPGSGGPSQSSPPGMCGHAHWLSLLHQGEPQVLLYLQLLADQTSRAERHSGVCHFQHSPDPVLSGGSASGERQSGRGHSVNHRPLPSLFPHGHLLPVGKHHSGPLPQVCVCGVPSHPVDPCWRPGGDLGGRGRWA